MKRHSVSMLKSILLMLAVVTVMGTALQPAMAQVCPGTITVTKDDSCVYTITMNNTPNAVVSFGFDVTYDPAELTYAGYSIAGCISEGKFDFFQCSNPTPGTLKVGGFAAIAPGLAAGSSGSFIKLTFTCIVTDAQICVQNLVDQMAGWCNLCGGVDCPNCCCLEINDIDLDGIPDDQDNCPNNPNGPNLGTCTSGPREKLGITTCTSNTDCDPNGFCSMDQEDIYPPGGNGVGDACDCEGNFNCDADVDGSDAFKFKEDFGRSTFNRPCPDCKQCITTTVPPITTTKAAP